MKKILFILLFAMLASIGVGYAGQEAAAGGGKPKRAAAAKPAHWSGAIVRTDKDAATITVKKKGGMEKTIYYDSATKWTTKAGGPADPSTLKEGDRVVCNGMYEENKFKAGEIILQTPK